MAVLASVAAYLAGPRGPVEASAAGSVLKGLPCTHTSVPSAPGCAFADPAIFVAPASLALVGFLASDAPPPPAPLVSSSLLLTVPASNIQCNINMKSPSSNMKMFMR